MKRCVTICFLLIGFSLMTNAQKLHNGTAAWKLLSYSGDITLNGLYRNQHRTGKQFEEIQQTMLFIPSATLRTKSFVWHPNFLLLDLDGTYSPTRSSQKFLTLPDQTENRDLKKLEARYIFFAQNKMNISGYYNHSELLSNRENLTSLKSKGNYWGTTLSYRNKLMPLAITYANNSLDQTEIETGRNFKDQQRNLSAHTNFKTGKTGRHDLTLAHNEYYRKEFSNADVSNKINSLIYNNHGAWNQANKSGYNTFLSGLWQTGNQNFNRFQANENLYWDLRRKFRLEANYNYFADKRTDQSVDQHRVGGALRHQLYESLTSQISYNYNTTQYQDFSEQLQQGLLDLSYTKRIARVHRLDIAFKYMLQSHNWQGQDGTIRISREAILLQDGQITLLSRPYINATTVVVMDATGTIVYRENLDYLLVQQSSYLQVKRIPGGQIADNSTVYVDYTALQPGTYAFASKNKFLQGSFSLFNRLLSVYYRRSVQDYDNLQKTEMLTLNYFTQNVVGFKFEYKQLSGGMEWDDMNSTVLPYQLLRYYVNFNKPIRNKLIVSLNGNVSDYKVLNNLNDVRYVDMNGSVLYILSRRVSVRSTLNYMLQKGDGVDLNLLSSITEINATIKKLRFSVYYHYYDRTIFSEMTRFNSVNVQLVRTF